MGGCSYYYQNLSSQKDFAKILAIKSKESGKFEKLKNTNKLLWQENRELEVKEEGGI